MGEQDPQVPRYSVEVRQLGPLYTYVIFFPNRQRPWTLSTGFFDDCAAAETAAHKKAAELLEAQQARSESGRLRMRLARARTTRPL